MQILKRLAILLVVICPLITFAQTTYLPEGSKEYQFIDRLEIKQGNFSDLNYSTIKPYSRKAIVAEVESIDSAGMGYSNSLTGNNDNKWAGLNLSKVDKYNIHSILMNSSEWVTGPKESFLSKKPILNTFYTTKPNLLEVYTQSAPASWQAEHGNGGLPRHLVFLPRQRLQASDERCGGSCEDRRGAL